MKCPKCGYNSFNYLNICKKCSAHLNPEAFYGHQIYKNVKDANDKSEIDLADYVSDLPESYKKSDIEKMPENNKDKTLSSSDSIPEFFVAKKDEFKNVFDKLEETKTEPIDKTNQLETVIVKKRKDEFKNVFGSVQKNNFGDKKDDLSDSTVVVNNFAPNFASIESRFLAFLIDWTLIVLLSMAAFVSGIRQINLDYSYDLDGLFLVLIQVYLVLLFFASTYFLFLLGYSGKTIGKMLLKIKVVKENGQDIGFYESTKRWFGYMISIAPLFIGVLWALFDKKKQSFHDKIANTIVIKTLD